MGAVMPQFQETANEVPRRRSGGVPRLHPTAPAPERAEAPDLERQELPRRALNVAVALTGLVLAAPLMLVIAVLVKLTSRGPVIYTQTRVGLDRRGLRPLRHDSRRRQDIGGRPFTMYKFRTMRVDAEQGTGAVWAQANDDRVTPIGRVLRQYRLDELPQLWNVVKGDMNIVGPRPERPSIFQDLRREIPNYHLRQRARPGITGWAQVNQEYDTCLDSVKRKVELDLEYVGRQGVAEDLKIMMRTVPVMLFRRGGW